MSSFGATSPSLVQPSPAVQQHKINMLKRKLQRVEDEKDHIHQRTEEDKARIRQRAEEEKIRALELAE